MTALPVRVQPAHGALKVTDEVKVEAKKLQRSMLDFVTKATTKKA